MARRSISDHRNRILSLIHTPQPTSLPLTQCLGLVLAEPIVARIPVPPFTNSAMDGFAVAAADIPGQVPFTLPVLGDIPAGDTRLHTHQPGYAWRIMTGAMMPAGCDTVIKVEETDHDGLADAPAQVTFTHPVQAGANVRLQGEALAADTVVFEAGRVLDAAALSACASVGYGALCVWAAPRVVVVTTGSELVEPGHPVQAGQIPDSNGILLAGLIEQAGGVVETHLRLDDHVPAFIERIETAAAQADLVITVGGISAGAFEVVRQRLADDGAFYAVDQQPGGPQGSGHIQVGGGRRVPVICVPGNPVSVFVTFHVYIREALERLAGRTAGEAQPYTSRLVDGFCVTPWSSPAQKTQFMPITVSQWREEDGQTLPVVTPTHTLGSRSHLVISLAEADGLAVIAKGIDGVAAGERIPILPTRLDAFGYPVLVAQDGDRSQTAALG